MSRTYIIKDKSGLHARPAALVVNTASKFSDEISIEYKGTSYNLKSIMIVMSLGVRYGEEITISANGDKAEDVLNSIESILKESNIV